MQIAESVIIMKYNKTDYRIWLCGTTVPEIWLAESPNESAPWGAVPTQYISSAFPELPRHTHGQSNNEHPVAWLQRTILQSINYTIMTNHNS